MTTSPVQIPGLPYSTGQVAPITFANDVGNDINFLIAKPMGRLFQTSAQTISNATTTTLNLPAANTSYAQGGVTAPGGNGLSLPVAGKYRMVAVVQWATLSAAMAQGVLTIVNSTGPTNVAVGGTPLASGSIDGSWIACGSFICAANDFITVTVFQSSGASQTLSATAASVYLEVEWLSN